MPVAQNYERNKDIHHQEEYKRNRKGEPTTMCKLTKIGNQKSTFYGKEGKRNTLDRTLDFLEVVK
jgi:hypothetical protein